MRRPPDISPEKLGRWGELHRESLVQNRPDLARKLGRARLLEQCRDVNAQAESRYKLLLQQGADPDQAREIVLSELVLVPDLETERAMREGYTD